MTLGFKTKRKDGTKTNFVEKIWAGFALNNDLLKWDAHLDAYGYKHNLPWEWFNTFLVSKPKIHSIREDKPNRWKSGNDIHFVIGNRTKNRYLFCPIIPVISKTAFSTCSSHPPQVILFTNNSNLMNYAPKCK